ncbi:MBL fold metallo-hydrolase [candidate division GN15 bacterium]|nr:MBL fold metallo-hydrolase [candidate division GN15 bacterium]
MIQLAFHGAAGTVTGSKYLITVNNSRILIDCGFFQGPKALRRLNWEAPPFKPAELDAVVLTHAHIDHIGYLPRVVKQGYDGVVYGTSPTVDLAQVSLLDSAHLQEEDARYRNKKRLTSHPVALPLYTTDDAEVAIRQLQAVPYETWIEVADGIRFRLHVVGHVLGAAGVEVEADDGERKVTVFFSGDVGRYGNPLTIDPGVPPECDYLVCESTYGGRLHPPEDPRSVFSELINNAVERKAVLLIPAFAISRTQQITFLVAELIRHGLVPEIDLHLDSPMAISATEVFCKYHAFHRVDIQQIGGPGCVLEGKRVTLHRKRKSSKTLNKLKGPAIIMSSSGMLTGGRILHHLMNRLDDEQTTVVLAGYMAEGTLGRRLADGADRVRIHKYWFNVKAKIVQIHGLSGHADFYEILHWLEPIERAPKKVFVTHGEASQTEAMAQHLKEKRGWNCHIPTLHETVELT